MFAELLARTNYSFLEGASHPDEMVGRAKELGVAALGVADRDGFYGIVKAHVAAKTAGLPLVLGARMTVEGIGAPVALLAKDGAGYAALCALITAGRMRNGKGMCTVTLDEIAACARGCFAVATSFLQFFPRTPPFATGTTPPPVVRPVRRGGDQLRGEVALLREIFGDALSIAVARHFSAGDDARFSRAVSAANALGVPLLATNDPYVHAPERQPLHDVVTAIRERTTVAALGTRRLPSAEWHLKSPAAMRELFADRPDAIERGLAMAKACTFSLDSIRYRYPDEWLPKGFTAIGWLRHLVGEGTRARYSRGTPAAVAHQLAHELKLIEELDFAPYFLTVWDIVRFARERKILCQGRGSAANSAVCFVLGITSIDPVRMNLLFERFISAERGEPPDIDVDFEHERREEVIQHLYAKYGRDRAAMVANIITYRERLAVREVGKALGLSETQIGRLAHVAGERDLDWKNEHFESRGEWLGEIAVARKERDERTKQREGWAPGNTGRQYRGARPSSDTHDRYPETPLLSKEDRELANMLGRQDDDEPEMRLPDATGKSMAFSTPERVLAKQGLDVSEKTIRQVLSLTRELLGFPRHLGIHSGGFSITHGKLCEIVPTENATMPGRSIVEWDKEDLASVGILKIDVLSLGMLTMIRKALDLLRLHDGIDLDLATIPAEDEATYDMICAADTIGVFQIESRAQMNMLPRLKPRNFYDLVIEIALIRPGPITGGMVQPLLRRRRGEEKVVYAHPILEPILARTYGVPVFQEQAIKLAVAAAGFTPGEAEELRRSMTHKRSTERMARLHDRLMGGMADKGIPAPVAEEIVSQLSGFAGYGFPESHSASFALLVYASSWLKCHHPAVFCAALLNSQPMGFYAPHTIVSDAQRHGVPVLGVDVTRSHWDCTLEDAPREKDGVHRGDAEMRREEAGVGVDRASGGEEGFNTEGHGEPRREEIGLGPSSLENDRNSRSEKDGFGSSQAEHNRGSRQDKADSSKPVTDRASFERGNESRDTEAGGDRPQFSSPKKSSLRGPPWPSVLKNSGPSSSSGDVPSPHAPGPDSPVGSVVSVVNFEERVTTPIEVAVDGPPPPAVPEAAQKHAVRIGYRYVRGLSVRVKEKLEAALGKGGPFTSWEDMVARARLPRDAMARIAAADGFRSLGLSRREALWMALRQPPSEEEVFADGGHGEEAGRIVFPELDGHGAMLADYDAMGFSTVSHPVSFLREDFDRRRIMDSRALAKAKNRAWVKIGGMAIVRQRPPTAGNVVFLTLEDEWGFLNLVIRPEIYDHYRTLCRDELFVVVEGTVERAGKAINVQAERFEVAVPNDAAESASIGLPDGHPRHPHRVRESPVAHQATTPQPADSRGPKEPKNIRSRDFH